MTVGSSPVFSEWRVIPARLVICRIQKPGETLALPTALNIEHPTLNAERSKFNVECRTFNVLPASAGWPGLARREAPEVAG
jgi:hypothetical protein